MIPDKYIWTTNITSKNRETELIAITKIGKEEKAIKWHI